MSEWRGSRNRSELGEDLRKIATDVHPPGTLVLGFHELEDVKLGAKDGQTRGVLYQTAR